jgi:hypothetical protein
MVIPVLECYRMNQHKTLAVATRKNVEEGFFSR